MDHRELREHLAAYALGALDAADRQRVEHHLADCPSCREELGSLAAVRPLLDRLDEEDLDVTAIDLPGAEALVANLAGARRRERRRLLAWQAVAGVAAVAAAVTLVITRPDAPRPSESLAIREVTTAAADAGGEVEATAWEWGTTVSLRLTSLPTREGYVVWVVAADGRREQAGTWGPTQSGRAIVRGASGILVDEIERVEITDAAGSVLLVFAPAHPAA